MSELNVLVFGAGAIGTYIGGSLALHGHHVTFIEQPGAVEVLKMKGLSLELSRKKGSAVSTFTVTPSSFNCLSSVEKALLQAPFDVAIFALKSFDTAAALEGMQPFAGVLPPFLCLSNGVENEPALAALLGADRVIPGTVTSSVGRRGVGHIVLERLRGVGVADGHPLTQALVDALTDAGLNAHIIPRAADMKWSKMLTNLPANASVAILDMTPGEVLSHPGLFRIEMSMLRETLAVMAALGINVVDLPGVPVKALALGARLPGFIARLLLTKAVGGGRGGKMPSFHIDLHAGRGKSEVEWLNGAVVRFGRQVGVPTTVNQVLTDTLLKLTRGEIPLQSFSRQPGKLLELVGSV
jgi:2-dehydropantoate 2-reductase